MCPHWLVRDEFLQDLGLVFILLTSNLSSQIQDGRDRCWDSMPHKVAAKRHGLACGGKQSWNPTPWQLVERFGRWQEASY